MVWCQLYGILNQSFGSFLLSFQVLDHLIWFQFWCEPCFLLVRSQVQSVCFFSFFGKFRFYPRFLWDQLFMAYQLWVKQLSNIHRHTYTASFLFMWYTDNNKSPHLESPEPPKQRTCMDAVKLYGIRDGCGEYRRFLFLRNCDVPAEMFVFAYMFANISKQKSSVNTKYIFILANGPLELLNWLLERAPPPLSLVSLKELDQKSPPPTTGN